MAGGGGVTAMLRKLALALAALALLAAPALAQSSPGLAFGAVPTPAQWNGFFSAKQDYLGSPPCIVSGCSMQGELGTAASTANMSGLNVPHGVAPSNPINGDIWTTTAGLFGRINGSTVQFTTGGASISPGTTNDVPYYSSTSNLAGVALTGLVLASTSAPPAAYGGTSCGSGQAVTSLSAAGAAGCGGQFTFAVGSGVGLSLSGCAPASLSGTCTLSATTDTPRWTGLGLGGAAPATGIEVYNAVVAPTGNGQGMLGASATNGATLTGQGSSFDVALVQRSGAVACGVPAGATQFTCGGAANLTGGGSLAGTFSGTPTLSGANFVTLANIVQDATAWSILGNASGSTANYAPFRITDLTAKGTPATNDQVLIWDVSGAAMKYATVSSIAAGSTVASINGLTGALNVNPTVSASGTTIDVPFPKPGGRLTLLSGTPVMTSNQVNKATLYYDCAPAAGGNQWVPYFDGTNDQVDVISGCEVSTAMQSSGTGVLNTGGVFDVWWVHSGTNRICVATNGSGGGWASDTGGSNTARGTGYSQVDATTRPYVTNKNAIANCYNGSTNYGSVSANRATYLGTIYTTAAGQTGMSFAGAASSGFGNVLGVFNAYNKTAVVATNQDSKANWIVPNATWRQADNSSANTITWVDGLATSSVDGRNDETVESLAANGGVVGCQADWTSGAPSFTAIGTFAAGTSVYTSISAPCASTPLAGVHVMSAVEAAYTTNSVLVYGSGFGGATSQVQQLMIRLMM